MTFGAPPGRCDIGRVELPVDAEAPGLSRRLSAELPDSARGADPIEIGLSVDHPFLASYLIPGKRDTRLVSLMVKRIAIDR